MIAKHLDQRGHVFFTVACRDGSVKNTRKEIGKFAVHVGIARFSHGVETFTTVNYTDTRTAGEAVIALPADQAVRPYAANQRICATTTIERNVTGKERGINVIEGGEGSHGLQLSHRTDPATCADI